MSYITREQLTFRKLSELQSQLLRIEIELPSPTELIRIAEEYESLIEKSATIFSLMLHISCLKAAQARFAILCCNFERLKPKILEILDRSGDNGKNLGGSVAFFTFVTEQERLGNRISDQICQVKTLLSVIDLDSGSREYLKKTLDSVELLEFAKNLKLTY